MCLFQKEHGGVKLITLYGVVAFWQAFRLRRGGGGRKKTEKKAFWWVPVYHGFHVVVDGESDCDSVVVQREQFGETELWFFGVFDAEVGDGVTKYMQSHFFNKNLKEVTQNHT